MLAAATSSSRRALSTWTRGLVAVPGVSPAQALAVSRTRIGVTGRAPDVTLLAAHATGFCGGVWQPVVAALAPLAAAAGISADVVALDFSGHGGSRARVTDPRLWRDFTVADLTAALDGVAGRVVGVGHSFGAAGLLLHEVAAPGTYAAIVAIEPVVFDARAVKRDATLAAGAARRKSAWPSRAAADAYFRSKGLFARWHPDALAGYLSCGLVPTPAGGVVLACDPAFESLVYTGTHDCWAGLPGVACPVTVVAGGDTAMVELFGVPPLPVFASVAARLPRGTFVTVPGGGHFLPQELPAETARAVAVALGWAPPVGDGVTRTATRHGRHAHAGDGGGGGAVPPDASL